MEAKVIIGRTAKVTHFSWDGGSCWVCFGLDNIQVLSVFCHDYGWSCFVLICPACTMALSDIGVLCNCLFSRGECQGLADSTRPAPGCQGLLFSFSS